jgi:hypothetical protein
MNMSANFDPQTDPLKPLPQACLRATGPERPRWDHPDLDLESSIAAYEAEAHCYVYGVIHPLERQKTSHKENNPPKLDSSLSLPKTHTFSRLLSLLPNTKDYPTIRV